MATEAQPEQVSVELAGAKAPAGEKAAAVKEAGKKKGADEELQLAYAKAVSAPREHDPAVCSVGYLANHRLMPRAALAARGRFARTYPAARLQGPHPLTMTAASSFLLTLSIRPTCAPTHGIYMPPRAFPYRRRTR
jgi:hypothetical protein